MKILVLGATGATGFHIVSQALEAAHEVSVYVRNPHKLPISHPQLRVIRGQLEDSTALKEALKGQDVVISALAHKRLIDPKPYMAHAIRVVLEGMNEHGVKRLYYLSAYGVGDTANDMPVIFSKLVLPLILKYPFADHERAEETIRASDRDWLIAKPTLLTNGSLSDRYVEKARLPQGAKRSISRADVAHFMVKNLNEGSLMNRSVGLTSS